VHCRALLGQSGLQLLEVYREVTERVVLGGRSREAHVLPVRDLGDDCGALGPDRRRGVGQIAPLLSVVEGHASGHGEGRHTDIDR